MSDTASLEPPRVFLVHRKADEALAERLGRALREDYGIDAWFEGWEMLGGDVLVLRIEDGLARADGALVLVTAAGLDEPWARQQYAAVVEAAIEGDGSGRKKFVIPVIEGEAPKLPELLGTRRAIAADDHEGIVRTILQHLGRDLGDKPALGKLFEPRRPVRVELGLHREGEAIVVRWGEHEGRVRLSRQDAASLRASLRVSGPTRRDGAATPMHATLARMGSTLGAAFDGPLGTALAEAVGPSHDRGEALVELRSADPQLSSLPWEAAVVPGLGPLALVDRLTVARELDVPQAPAAAVRPAIPGPLRILVAVASPRDDLDVEREQEVILTAVEATRHARSRVVFADDAAATLDAIRRQLDADPFHVLHVSCHGRPGALAFEDADGERVDVSADQLATVLRQVKHPPAVVVLSACSTAARPTQGTDGPAGDVDRLDVAQALVHAGVPHVIAMQGPVGDGYATELAGFFYGELARSPEPVPARALAVARRAVERERLRMADAGQVYRAAEPEYATPVSVTAAGHADVRLYDGTRPCEPVEMPSTSIVDASPSILTT